MEKKKQLATMGKRKRGQLPFLIKKKKIMVHENHRQFLGTRIKQMHGHSC
jgi:hypothetical protein